MKDISKVIAVEKMTPDNKVCFFGYYDISPENLSGTKVLYNMAPFGDHMPTKNDELIVGYYSFEKAKYYVIDSTTAWNFQEGCRLQWINDNKCIYNVRRKKGYGSVVYDTLKGSIVHEYNFPVYNINGSKCLFYNFNRSRYSYAHELNEEKTDYSRDGIFIADLISGESKNIIVLEKLSRDAKAEKFNNWVEHCSFNPSGDHFCFFHRWIDQSGSMHTRFCVSDLGGNYKVLLNEGFCSHFGWKNDKVITAWGRLPSKINAIQGNTFLKNTGLYRGLVSIYHTLIKGDALRQKISNDSYIYFDIETCNKWKLEEPYFIADGHCTWSKDERYMLTDTYPDSDNLRSLMIYDSKEKEVYLLGKFFSYPDVRDKERYKLAGIRCDLHPKWTYKETYVYFDSTHEGYRGLYRAKVDRIDHN
jgi:hypothetical protein